MECKRCGNKEKQYFAYNQFHDAWYCRKCIAFGRINVNEEVVKKEYIKKKHSCHYELKYPLTPFQQKAVSEIRMYLDQRKDVLVYAACGAGKTELVMDSIMRYLNQGKKVGFAISRRQVVLEIRERMAQAFPMLTVIAVCEGFTEVTDADLIICTMHQLYRYPDCFDLLIMDEVDAFPYRGNELLEAIAMKSCVGQKLCLTATPDETMLERVKRGELALVELFQRPHGYPLIVPEIKHTLPSLQFLYLIQFLHDCKKQSIQVLVFVPTIKEAKKYHRLLRLWFRCAVFTSKTEDKEKVIDDFHDLKYDLLISTTILERGITIKGIYIIILHADHMVFNEASLIQMIGRVGRNIEMPTGRGVFLCTRVTSDIKRCVRALKKMNESLTINKTVKLEESL